MRFTFVPLRLLIPMTLQVLWLPKDLLRLSFYLT